MKKKWRLAVFKFNIKEEHVGAMLVVGKRLKTISQLPPVSNELLLLEVEHCFTELKKLAEAKNVNHEAVEFAAGNLGATVIRFLTEYDELADTKQPK